MDPPENNKKPDSKTLDAGAGSDRRVRVTIRCKPEIKDALNKFCLKNGLSICHVFELLVSGYLTGVQQKINFGVISPTIELSVVREVKRIRRYAHERVPPEFEEYGGRERCSVSGCKSPVFGVVQFEEHPSHYLVQWFCRAHFGERQKELRRLRRPFGFREV